LYYISTIIIKTKMQNSKLKSGNYMRVSKVIETLNHKFCRPTVSSIIEKICTKHEGEYDIYYNTKDLRNVIESSLFRELECEVTTHIIENEK
jgi:hypothetical protein